MDDVLASMIGDCYQYKTDLFDVFISKKLVNDVVFRKLTNLSHFDQMKFLMENCSVKYNKNLFVGFDQQVKLRIISHYQYNLEEKLHLCDLVTNGHPSGKIGPYKKSIIEMTQKNIIIKNDKICVKKIIYYPIQESTDQFHDFLDWAQEARGVVIRDVKYLGFTPVELEGIRKSW